MDARHMCAYAVDRGVNCRKWLPSTETYCTEHIAAIAAIDQMMEEVNDIIKKAREK